MSGFSYNTILIKVRHRDTHEFLAEGAISPGELLKIDPTDGDVIRNPDAADDTPHHLIAIEDATQGRGVSDAYANNERVICYVPLPGDILWMKVENGAVITYGAQLEHGSAGNLQIATTGAPVAIAQEAFTASGIDFCKVMWMPLPAPNA